MTNDQSARLPDPRSRNPLGFPGGAQDPATVFLSEVIDHPNIQVGDWTYYNDRTLPQDYAAVLAPYLCNLSKRGKIPISDRTLSHVCGLVNPLVSKSAACSFVLQ